MNPYDEKRLRDEVIYLHYLWQQGPPQSSNQTPQGRPSPSTQNPNNKRKFVHLGPYSPPKKPDHGLDWSVHANPTSHSSPGWPEPKSKLDPTVRPVSIEDQARFASMQMQKKVLERFKLFFNTRVHDEENAVDDDDDVDEEGKNEVDMFLMSIFVNNSELRGYYEENHEKGEFFCLVCGGIGENVGKKFKGCVGLVQHCMSISKTKSKIGHRAFGLVVCKVLGWDCDRLPVILLKGEPLSRILANSRESQNTLKGDGSNTNVDLETKNSDGEVLEEASNSLDKGDDLNVDLGNVVSANAIGSESVEREVSSIDQSNGELIAHNMSNNSLKSDDSNENIESLEIADGEPNKGAVNDLGLDSSQITTTGWPCIEPVDESTSTSPGWPSFMHCTAPVTHLVPAEEQIRINMAQFQVNVFEACKQFLSTTAESDSDEGDDEDESKDSEEFNFFLRLFTENNGLRSYYETNCRGGDFWCLVCRGIGKKDWRTFKDCVGLIQHSTAISKTKRKRAHRAFGQVICKVLNWDIDHLPSIILKSESQNQSLVDMSQVLDSSQITTNGWPCTEPVDESTSTNREWPSFTPCTAPVTYVFSAEEQTRVDMVQFQVNVFEACKQFLSTTAETDSGEDDEFDEDEDEDGSKDSQEFNFFLKLFTENNGLRSYYETNCRGGDFWCLVCRGIKKKAWRTFKDCVGLIQHSTAVSNSKGKRAHRAFGQVICKVLNWDIAHLPSIILKSEPQSHSLEDFSQNSLNAKNENVESLEISDGKPNKGAVNDLGLDSSQITATGWPCTEPVDESTSTTLEWPSFTPSTAPVTHVLSAQDQIRVDMVQFQVNVFEACKQFLSITAESDSGEDDEFDEGKDGDGYGSKDSEEFNFFLKLFTENNELRSYYETNCRGGDFWCLVCRGIRKKAWRTFKDCVGLIQHSTAISNTKGKRAHRAFGQVICKVLNWDMNHLPSMILKRETHSRSSEDLSQNNGKAACGEDGSDGPMDITDSELGLKEDVDADQNNSMLTSSENTLNETIMKINQ